MREKILFWEALFGISSVSARNYLFNVSNWSIWIRCEEFRIKNDDNGVVLVSVLLTMNIFQTCSNCWIWKSKRLWGSYWKDQHFWRQDRVYHALCCNILKFISKWHLILYLHNLTSESVKNFCEGIYFRLSFCLKNCDSHSKWLAVRFCLLEG